MFVHMSIRSRSNWGQRSALTNRSNGLLRCSTTCLTLMSLRPDDRVDEHRHVECDRGNHQLPHPQLSMSQNLELSQPSIHLWLSPFGRQEFTIPTFWHLTEKVLHELLELRRGVFVDHDEFDK